VIRDCCCAAGRYKETAALDLALKEVQADFDALLESDMFRRGRRLRRDAIAHILIRDHPTVGDPSSASVCQSGSEIVSGSQRWATWPLSIEASTGEVITAQLPRSFSAHYLRADI
jgi:hypothetical protein